MGDFLDFMILGVFLFMFLLTSKYQKYLIRPSVSIWIMEKAAEELGLAVKKMFRFSPSLSGTINGHRVSVRVIGDGGNNLVQLQVYAYHTLPVKEVLTIKKENSLSRMKRSVGMGDCETGDQAFDEMILIESENTLNPSALLNRSARSLILTLAGMTESFEINRSWIFAILAPSAVTDARSLSERIRLIVDVCGALSGERDLKKRLMDTIESDPVDHVRLKCIVQLASHYPLNDEIRNVLRGRLNDEDIPIRIEAARRLGGEGVGHLLKMLKDGTVSGPEQAAMVLAVIGENGDKKTVMVLQQFYSEAGDLTVKRHALRALVGLGDEELCPWLLSELDRATGAIEKLDLVEALGDRGTADEIEPLRIMFESSRNAKLRSTISSAVEKIRSRVTGAEAGWLTLSYTGEMEGALSRDNGSGGELSSAEEE